MKVSVAMATYNGQQYIREQIDSIINQLEEHDELVISDDGSTDETIKIIKTYMEHDQRVKLYMSNKKNVVENFGNAIERCQNELIFLCDQDDVWLEHKVETMKDYFVQHAEVDMVMSDISVVDEKLNVLYPSFFKLHNSRTGIIKNIVKTSYIGCSLAFRSKMRKDILPIPKNVPMHDMWIGSLCEIRGNVALINEPLMLYRRHGNNVTGLVESKVGIGQKVKWRIDLVYLLIKRLIFKR